MSICSGNKQQHSLITVRDYSRFRIAILSAIYVLFVYGCKPNAVSQNSQQLIEEGYDSSILLTSLGAFDPVIDSLPVFEDSERQNVAQTADKQADTVVDTRIPKIVQFIGRIEPSWKKSVEDLGLEIRGYIPHNSLIVLTRVNSADTKDLLGLPFVRTVVEQTNMLKIDPRLVATIAKARMLGSHRENIKVNIEMSDPNQRANIEQWIVSHRGEVLNRPKAPGAIASKILKIKIPTIMLAALSSRTDIVSVEPSYPKKLMNDRTYGVVQSGKLYSRPIWDHGLRGQNQIVAFADTGLYLGSCFFVGENKIVHYEDLGDTNEGDVDGHGTHVAGSIAGDKFSNNDYDVHDGIAPAAQLYVQDIAAGDELIGIEDDLSSLFDSSYLFGARIHSNSWGDQDNSYSSMSRSVDDYVNHHRDFLVVVANGNAGEHGANTVGSPATAKNVISVGALNGDAFEDIAYFSSQGPTSDGRVKPTLVTPGMNIVSASNRGSCKTQSLSGTSMATPSLAGASALVRQYFMEGYYPSGSANPENAFTPSAALLKAVMLVGAENMRGSSTLGQQPSNGQGFGRLQLSNSLYFVGDSKRLWVKDEDAGLQTDQEIAFRVTLKKSGALHVALTWLDPPATPGAGLALVNDLDLEVIGPNGRWLGNGSNRRHGAAKTETADKVNVEEVIHLPNVKAGNYVVVVKAANIPLGPQPFGLAIAGNFSGDVEISGVP